VLKKQQQGFPNDGKIENGHASVVPVYHFFKKLIERR
jgi:hypothetical protein